MFCPLSHQLLVMSMFEQQYLIKKVALCISVWAVFFWSPYIHVHISPFAGSGYCGSVTTSASASAPLNPRFESLKLRRSSSADVAQSLLHPPLNSFHGRGCAGGGSVGGSVGGASGGSGEAGGKAGCSGHCHNHGHSNHNSLNINHVRDNNNTHQQHLNSSKSLFDIQGERFLW